MIVERVKWIKEIYSQRNKGKVLWFSFSLVLTDFNNSRLAPYKTLWVFAVKEDGLINVALSYKIRNGWDKRLYDENINYIECDFNNFCKEKNINWTISDWEDFFSVFRNKETAIEDILDYIKTLGEIDSSFYDNIHIDFWVLNPNLE